MIIIAAKNETTFQPLLPESYQRNGLLHAEVKSMRTAADRRGNGVASRLLEHVLAEAKRKGFSRLSLETGATEPFFPARRLYEKFGFEYCGPFADYRPDPNSVFMTRAL